MKTLLVCLLVTMVSTCWSSSVLVDRLLDSQWHLFKMKHTKVYESAEIELQRRLIWESNWRYIERHNLEVKQGSHLFTLSMNQFGDLTNLEFARVYNGFNATKTMHKKLGGRPFLPPAGLVVPDSVDWRTQGYVTPVKDQGQCGSCWAFSAVASLEGQHYKAAGKLVSLSEQNLVDCSRKQGNMGCDGGLMDQAFTYIKINKGIDTEESYPYHAMDQKCKFNPATVGATDSGFTDITAGSEDDLVAALATVGPISVAIDASQSSFQFYSKGIYSDPSCSSEQLDHGVTAVGYGSLGSNQDFYIVKNSWGTSWGDQGYILMARNKKNMCGIATIASYPIV